VLAPQAYENQKNTLAKTIIHQALPDSFACSASLRKTKNAMAKTIIH